MCSPDYNLSGLDSVTKWYQLSNAVSMLHNAGYPTNIEAGKEQARCLFDQITPADEKEWDKLGVSSAYEELKGYIFEVKNYPDPSLIQNVLHWLGKR